MINNNFEELIQGMITESAPMSRDQSVPVIDNVQPVVEKLAEIADDINEDKAGYGESYKLDPRRGVADTHTVFVYSDRPNVTADISELTSASSYITNTIVEVRGGSNLTTIGDNAFLNKVSLKKVDAPAVTIIDDAAFVGCVWLEEIYAPHVTTVGDQAFGRCASLKSVDFPDCTSVGSLAFSDCQHLTAVRLQNVNSVGARAFSGCSTLERISLPRLKILHDETFKNCVSLREVDIPECTAIDGTAVFTYASSVLEILNFGDTLTSVANLVSGGHTQFKNAAVIVPTAKYEEWKQHEVWSLVPALCPANKAIIVRTNVLEDYAKKTDLAGYLTTAIAEATYLKKTDIVPGQNVNVGDVHWADAPTPNDNHAAISDIVFTPEAIGLLDGGMLKSITLRARAVPTGNPGQPFPTTSLCIKVSKYDSAHALMGTSQVLTMDTYSKNYTFVFDTPFEVTVGTQYQIEFFESPTSSTTKTAPLNLYNSHVPGEVQRDFDVYVGGNNTHYRYIHPYIESEYYIPATRNAIQALVTETLKSKLSSIIALEPIGSGNYGADDIKDRFDLLITALKSL